MIEGCIEKSNLASFKLDEPSENLVTADRVTVRFEQNEMSFVLPDALERGFLKV